MVAYFSYCDQNFFRTHCLFCIIKTCNCALFDKLMSFFCVCPVIDHEFLHNNVKVAGDPWGDRRVVPHTILTMLQQSSQQMHEKLRSTCFLTITNCQIFHSCLLCQYWINYKVMHLSAFWQWKFPIVRKVLQLLLKWQNGEYQSHIMLNVSIKMIGEFFFSNHASCKKSKDITNFTFSALKMLLEVKHANWTTDSEIQSISGRLLDNVGELALSLNSLSWKTKINNNIGRAKRA